MPCSNLWGVSTIHIAESASLFIKTNSSILNTYRTLYNANNGNEIYISDYRSNKMDFYQLKLNWLV